MADATRVLVERHLEVALGMRVDLHQVPDDVNLSSLGLDSLSVVSAIVSLSEECGVDLMAHMEHLLMPRDVGDLLAITSKLVARDRDATLASPPPPTT